MVNEMKNIKGEECDIIISFDVVSLFTKIPMKEAIRIIKDLTDDITTKIVEFYLKSTLFIFKGVLYKHIER
jgi:hypothetical protein